MCPVPSSYKALQTFGVSDLRQLILPPRSSAPFWTKEGFGLHGTIVFSLCNLVHVQPALSFHIAKIKSEFARIMISIYVKRDFPNATQERDFTVVTRGVK